MRSDNSIVVHSSIAKDAAGLDFAACTDARFTEKLDARLDQCVGANDDFRVDDHSFRKINGDAGIHQLGGFSRAENAVHIGEGGTRIAAENFPGVGSDVSEDAFIALAEKADYVCEIKLTMSIFRAQSVQARPKF